jgi:hypothetical protein
VVILVCHSSPISPVGIYHHISIVDWWLFCNILVCHSSPICLVDIYHHIYRVDWWLFWSATALQYVWWISTTISTGWTGGYFGLPQLSNMSGGYLPPYLQGGLVVILVCQSWPICLVDIYNHISIVDWWLFCNILVCHSSPICPVDIYHHINRVDWWLFWCARAGQYVWWISTTISTGWTGGYFGLPQLSNMSGGYLPPYLQGGLVLILVCQSWPICPVDIYHHISIVDWWLFCNILVCHSSPICLPWPATTTRAFRIDSRMTSPG